MSARPSPTVRGRRLRYELRRMRLDRGWTIEQVSERTGGDLTPSALSRWETGERRIRPGDLTILLGVYEVPPQQREVLLTLAREARQRGWWQSYRGDTVPEWFQVYLGLEAEAATIRDYQSELVPGLLQTAAYYRAVMQAAPVAGDEEAIERKVAVRMERQQRLAAADAPDLWVVMNEAVIRRPVGGPDVMREQLHQILAVAMRSHVTVQVLPFRAAAHLAMDGSFVILGFPEALDPDVAYVEAQVGSLFLEGLPEVERYTAVFAHLVAKAAGPEESAVMIAEAAADLA